MRRMVPDMHCPLPIQVSGPLATSICTHLLAATGGVLSSLPVTCFTSSALSALDSVIDRAIQGGLDTTEQASPTGLMVGKLSGLAVLVHLRDGL